MYLCEKRNTVFLTAVLLYSSPNFGDSQVELDSHICDLGNVDSDLRIASGLVSISHSHSRELTNRMRNLTLQKC